MKKYLTTSLVAAYWTRKDIAGAVRGEGEMYQISISFEVWLSSSEGLG
jgi:hypothetical protein